VGDESGELVEDEVTGVGRGELEVKRLVVQGSV